MAAIALTKEQKLKKQEDKIEKQLREITKEVDRALYDAGITKKAVAEVAGLDNSAITHQFKKGRITMPVYLAAQMLLEAK